MKKTIVYALLAVMSIGCATVDEGDSTSSVDPEKGLEVQGKGGGACPTTVSCPSSFGTYNTFMYAYHYTTQLTCWYRNSTTNAVASTSVPISATCSNCCAPGYCPDQRLNTITYAQSWTCSQ